MQLKIDRFNSKIFEIQMGNIILNDEFITEKDVDDIISEAGKKKFKNLSVKVNTLYKNQTNIFLRKGFKLVDTQVMFAIPLPGKIVLPFRDVVMKRWSNADKNKIMEIAKCAFKLDQFHSNTDLPYDKSDFYYEQWAKNSCEGFADDVFVIKNKDFIIGFITLHKSMDKATVGLAAIDPGFCGQGYFTWMLGNTIKKLSLERFQILRYGTQLSNIPVLRTMTRFQGKPEFSKYVLNRTL